MVPTLVGLLLGVPAAYAIAVFECKQGKKLSTFIMSVRIAPPIMSILPNYIIFAKLDLLGTLWPMLILYTLITLPMTIWLMPVYFRDVPMSLREAAIIDGCKTTGITTMYMYAEKLGLGSKTGLEVTESTGILAGRDSTTWFEGNTVQAAIGQSDNAFGLEILKHPGHHLPCGA